MESFYENPHLLEYYGVVLVLTLLFSATFFSAKMQPLRQWVGGGLLVAPILYFFLLLDAHTVNIPYTDDFNLLETVEKFGKVDGFIEYLKVLFEQVNQHRFAFERMVMLLMILFTGTVNIKTQILIGDLFLLGICYLLFLNLKRERISWYYFIPVPYVIFNLAYFENAFWGIAALQNTPLIFFALLSAYGLARKDRKGFWIALLAALLTTFTSGSGLLTLLIGVVMLAFQKRFKALIGWFLATVLILLFYFLFDYVFISSPGEKVWHHPIFNSLFLFSFWGNALFLDIRHPLVPSFHQDLIACVLLGAAIALLFAVWTLRLLIKRTFGRSDWFLWGAMMFVMGTGVMFVISRPISNYVMYGGTVFSRRYMTFGVVLLATCYVCLVLLAKSSRPWKSIVLVTGGLGFLVFNFVSYYMSIVQIRRLHDELVIDSYFWKNYRTFLSVGDKFTDIPFWNHPTKMRDLIIGLESEGLTDFYQFYDMPGHQTLIRETASGDRKFEGHFDAVSQYRNGENNHYLKYFKFFVTPKAEPKGPFYFVLESDKWSIVLPAVPVPNTVSGFLQKATYYSNNYEYSLYKPKLPEGKYRAWIMSCGDSGKWESVYTGKQVLFY